MGLEKLWIVLIVCAALCAVGFYKYVYFLSIGYGLAVAGGAVAIALLFLDGLEPVHILLLALFIAYGVRLSGFLLVRELKNAAYRRTLTEVAGDEKAMPVFVKLAIWVSVAVLYTAQVSPVFYRLYNGTATGALPFIGAAVSLFGLVLEAVADRQKSAQKAVNPNMVATQGLYRLVRCPNYLGEIVFWTGVFVGALDALTGAGQWILAVFAYLCIVMVMVNGAQRLEKRQHARYGADPAYRRYAGTTPILFPFTPLYHLCKEAKEEADQ